LEDILDISLLPSDGSRSSGIEVWNPYKLLLLATKVKLDVNNNINIVVESHGVAKA